MVIAPAIIVVISMLVIIVIVVIVAKEEEEEEEEEEESSLSIPLSEVAAAMKSEGCFDGGVGSGGSGGKKKGCVCGIGGGDELGRMCRQHWLQR